MFRNHDLYYLSGPCRNGHEGYRFRSTGRCVDCRTAQRRRYRRKKPWPFLLGNARERAKEKNIPYNLTKEWAEARYTGKCELTKIPFSINGRISFNPFSASIDRIDPHLGYTTDNCRFILMAVNAFKARMNDDQMYKIAKALVDGMSGRSTDSDISIESPTGGDSSAREAVERKSDAKA